MILMKAIEGYRGRYSVTKDGKIRSHPKRHGNGGLRNGRWLKPWLGNRGYLILNLRKNGKRKMFTVHRLVALAFIPNPKNKPEINHKDGNRLNNDYTNLEWCTRQENSDHAWKIGLFDNRDVKGEKSGTSKLTWDLVKEIRANHSKMKWGDKPYEKYGIACSSYYRALNGNTWKEVD